MNYASDAESDSGGEGSGPATNPSHPFPAWPQYSAIVLPHVSPAGQVNTAANPWALHGSQLTTSRRLDATTSGLTSTAALPSGLLGPQRPQSMLPNSEILPQLVNNSIGTTPAHLLHSLQRPDMTGSNTVRGGNLTSELQMHTSMSMAHMSARANLETAAPSLRPVKDAVAVGLPRTQPDERNSGRILNTDNAVSGAGGSPTEKGLPEGEPNDQGDAVDSEDTGEARPRKRRRRRRTRKSSGGPTESNAVSKSIPVPQPLERLAPLRTDGPNSGIRLPPASTVLEAPALYDRVIGTFSTPQGLLLKVHRVGTPDTTFETVDSRFVGPSVLRDFLKTEPKEAEGTLEAPNYSTAPQLQEAKVLESRERDDGEVPEVSRTAPSSTPTRSGRQSEPRSSAGVRTSRTRRRVSLDDSALTSAGVASPVVRAYPNISHRSAAGQCFDGIAEMQTTKSLLYDETLKLLGEAHDVLRRGLTDLEKKTSGIRRNEVVHEVPRRVQCALSNALFPALEEIQADNDENVWLHDLPDALRCIESFCRLFERPKGRGGRTSSGTTKRKTTKEQVNTDLQRKDAMAIQGRRRSGQRVDWSALFQREKRAGRKTDVAKCRLPSCSSETQWSTARMLKHMRAAHPEVFENYGNLDSQSAEGTQETTAAAELSSSSDGTISLDPPGDRSTGSVEESPNSQAKESVKRSAAEVKPSLVQQSTRKRTRGKAEGGPRTAEKGTDGAESIDLVKKSHSPDIVVVREPRKTPTSSSKTAETRRPDIDVNNPASDERCSGGTNEKSIPIPSQRSANKGKKSSAYNSTQSLSPDTNLSTAQENMRSDPSSALASRRNVLARQPTPVTKANFDAAEAAESPAQQRKPTRVQDLLAKDSPLDVLPGSTQKQSRVEANKNPPEGKTAGAHVPKEEDIRTAIQEVHDAPNPAVEESFAVWPDKSGDKPGVSSMDMAADSRAQAIRAGTRINEVRLDTCADASVDRKGRPPDGTGEEDLQLAASKQEMAAVEPGLDARSPRAGAHDGSSSARPGTVGEMPTPNPSSESALESALRRTGDSHLAGSIQKTTTTTDRISDSSDTATVLRHSSDADPTTNAKLDVTAPTESVDDDDAATTRNEKSGREKQAQRPQALSGLLAKVRMPKIPKRADSQSKTEGPEKAPGPIVVRPQNAIRNKMKRTLDRLFNEVGEIEFDTNKLKRLESIGRMDALNSLASRRLRPVVQREMIRSEKLVNVLSQWFREFCENEQWSAVSRLVDFLMSLPWRNDHATRVRLREVHELTRTMKDSAVQSKAVKFLTTTGLSVTLPQKSDRAGQNDDFQRNQSKDSSKDDQWAKKPAGGEAEDSTRWTDNSVFPRASSFNSKYDLWTKDVLPCKFSSFDVAPKPILRKPESKNRGARVKFGIEKNSVWRFDRNESETLDPEPGAGNLKMGPTLEVGEGQALVAAMKQEANEECREERAEARAVEVDDVPYELWLVAGAAEHNVERGEELKLTSTRIPHESSIERGGLAFQDLDSDVKHDMLSFLGVRAGDSASVSSLTSAVVEANPDSIADPSTV